MTVERLPSGLRLVSVDESEPWAQHHEANWRAVGMAHAFGGFAIVARDFDPATFEPTSRWVIVRGGLALKPVDPWSVPDFDAIEIPDNSWRYLYLNSDNTLGVAQDWPASDAYAPLGLVYTDADKITSIYDYRNAVRFIRAGMTIATPRRVVANYQVAPGDGLIIVDATAGMVTITMPWPANLASQLVNIKKGDATANIVRVTFSNVDTARDGTPIDLAARGGLTLFPGPDYYEVINRWAL